MKKIISLICLLAIVILTPCLSYGGDEAEEPITVPLYSNNSDEPENPGTIGRGHKIPPRLLCVIDFSENTVSVTLPGNDEILSYEIRNAEGSVFVAVYDDAASFVQQLSEMKEATIVLHTENYTYRGYFIK